MIVRVCSRVVAVRARLIETRLQINTFLLRKNCKILPLAYAKRDSSNREREQRVSPGRVS